jgi:hypothetical protein
MLKGLCLTVLVSGLSACGPARQTCEPGLGIPNSLFALYFGTAIRGRADLTRQEWQEFVDDTITPNLPNGYTVLDARGVWRSQKTHTTVSESTKVLLVALPNNPDSLGAINRIRAEYQVRFHQQLVGMIVQTACATF